MRRNQALNLAARTDRELAGFAATGDRQASGELVRRAGPVVFDVLRRMGAAPTLADDLVQDALLAALRGITSYRGDAAFSTWAVAIAARLYVKRYRKDARTQVMAEPPSAVDFAAPAGGQDDRIDLDRALAQLTPGQRLCVTLCHGAGMTHEEIAAAIGAPIGTVKSHVVRALQRLRALLNDRGEGEDR